MLKAPTRHIVLDELAFDSDPLELDEDTRLALEDTKLVVVRSAGHGQWKLLPNGFVGAVQIDDLLIEVKPKDKVGISQILFLLSYAKDPGFLPQNVEAETTGDLWAALGETLARLGERATSRGVLQGYVSQDEALRTVRGRIRMSDQATRRPGFMFPIEVTHDEYTIDIPENRILRAAVRRMLVVPKLDEEVRRRLLHLDRKLADVSSLVTGDRLPRWTPSRLNAAYVPALRIAEVVLRNMVAEASLGKLHVASFVVNMAKVFEDFVTMALTEALRKYPGRTISQYKTYMDEPCSDGTPRIVLKPDVVHFVDGEPTLIFDAKYKAASTNGQYPNADHYQMLAYATAMGRSDAWLIYAGSGTPTRRRVRNSDISVHEYPIDLSGRPSEVLARVESIAQRSFETTFISNHPSH
ncbi:McrC family protein [Glutamicibacter sp. HZAU]|uniref:McrC family protein n=1 Tax=Glutamicibacter sp. HZAU TaxID=2049891 RepID=UPI000FFC2B7B|nr:restriction endonuclease [Glutamicibacter sp. HZAU]RWZ82298.1 restriction endonuclease [Glutamicibacter sp. HZAU]